MSELEKDASLEIFTSAGKVVINDIPKFINIGPDSNDKVIKMKRDAYGGTYSISAISQYISQSACSAQQTITFTFSNLQIVIVTINYITNPIGTVVISGFFATAFLTDDLENSTTETIWLPAENEQSLMGLEAIVHSPIPNTDYRFSITSLLENKLNLSECKVFIEVVQRYLTFVDAEQLLNLRLIYSSDNWPEGTNQINIMSQTDVFLGRNLAQVAFDLLISKQNCCDKKGTVQFKNLINQITNYPRFTKVVRGKGESLVDKVFFLVDKFKLNIPKLDFLRNLIVYGMFRYYLWRLIKCNCFDISILYRKNTELFFDTLAQSDYEAYIIVFNLPAIKDYGKYFRLSKKIH